MEIYDNNFLNAAICLLFCILLPFEQTLRWGETEKDDTKKQIQPTATFPHVILHG